MSASSNFKFNPLAAEFVPSPPTAPQAYKQRALPGPAVNNAHNHDSAAPSKGFESSEPMFATMDAETYHAMLSSALPQAQFFADQGVYATDENAISHIAVASVFFLGCLGYVSLLAQVVREFLQEMLTRLQQDMEMVLHAATLRQYTPVNLSQPRREQDRWCLYEAKTAVRNRRQYARMLRDHRDNAR